MNWFETLWAVALLPLMFWLAGRMLRDMPDAPEGEPAHTTFFTDPANRPHLKKHGPRAFTAAAAACAATGAATLYFVPDYAMPVSAVGALAVLAGCMLWLRFAARREK